MTEICIDLGGSRVKTGVFREGRSSDAELHPVPSSAADLAGLLDALMRAAPEARVVGVAVPGVVDPDSSVLLAAHGKYDFLVGQDISRVVGDLTGLPVVVENDARAALVGETAVGPDAAAPGATDAVLVTLGTGIGTAAMLDSRLIRGRSGHAGILGGHVTVDVDGPDCLCGNRGCAEALASTWAIGDAVEDDEALAREFRPADGAPVGIREVVQVASRSEAVRLLLDRFTGVWAAAIVTMCHAYDPDVVIVSGGVMRSADRLLPELRRTVHERLWSSARRPQLIVPTAPEFSALRGLSVLTRAAREEHA